MTAYKITVETGDTAKQYEVTASTERAALTLVAADSPRDDLDHPAGGCPECDRVRALRKLADA